MGQFDKWSCSFSHLLMCMHGPVEMRPLCKWPLTTVHLSHFSPGSTSAALHLGSEIPQGLMPFIVLVMFIKTTAATVDVSNSGTVTKHFKTCAHRKKLFLCNNCLQIEKGMGMFQKHLFIDSVTDYIQSLYNFLMFTTEKKSTESN